MTTKLAVNLRKSSSLIILAKQKIKDVDKSVADYKVLLFNRHDKATFMPNSSVFPGGVCEAADESELWRKHFEQIGINKRHLEQLTQAKNESIGIYKNEDTNVMEREISLRITAIRETFEEVGVLFCRHRKSLQTLTSAKSYGNFNEDFDRSHWQHLVHNDATKFIDLCEHLDVIPDVWSLYDWSNWVTPASFKKRFDTAFYLIMLQSVPSLLPEKNEVKDYAWKTPAEYLKAYYNKEMWLPPPQVYELSRLLNFNELSQLKECLDTPSSAAQPIAALPVQYKCKNGLVNLLPGDDQYPIDPNSYNEIIKIDKTISEYRQEAKKVHRFEFFNSYDAVIRLENVEPQCAQIAPVDVNPHSHD